MIQIIAILNTGIFLFLGLLHFYWAAGGKWALAGAIPDALNKFGKKMPTQLTLATLAVAIGLLGFAMTTLFNYSTFGLEIPFSLVQKTTIVIGLIFLARAIGDLYYCGFFRKITEGVFAERDKAIYTPLCLYLGLSTLIMALG